MVPTQWTFQDGRSEFVNELVFSLAIIASVINTILLIRIYKSRSNLTVFHMSLVSMVISDTLCAYASVLSYGAHLLHSGLDYFWCYYSSTEFVSFLGISVASATLISVERYFHIVLGKTATFRIMSSILIFIWVFHIVVGFFPLMVNIDVVIQASETYCLPDLRRSDLLHRSYAILFVTFVISVLSVITIAYYKIWRKVVADGFKWNEKSSSSKNAEQQSTSHRSRAGTMEQTDTNMKTSASSSIRTSSNAGTSPKNNLRAQEGAVNLESNSSQTATTRGKQMAMTKKLAIITLALYLSWFGSLFSFLHQMITGTFVPYALDAFMGIFHFSHCILNPLIILTIDSRWRIRLNKLKVPF
ncbi:hypothetical protein BKA69DRAFT_288403 [Paraphysoderma sedebokerense]|nr:hypothetical protein BKA69DRAFT_288403 [Paraphysoderma sedebokerense]